VADQIAKAPDSSRDREFLCRKYGLNDKSRSFCLQARWRIITECDLLVSVLPEICMNFGRGSLFLPVRVI
jgi:hypothetical protein